MVMLNNNKRLCRKTICRRISSSIYIAYFMYLECKIFKYKTKINEFNVNKLHLEIKLF